jgi:hypothetical protein
MPAIPSIHTYPTASRNIINIHEKKAEGCKYLLIGVLGRGPQSSNRFEAQTSTEACELRSNERNCHSREALGKNLVVDSDNTSALT